MTGRVEGKVAFITGRGAWAGPQPRGQVAQEGADIIAIDVCRQSRTRRHRLRPRRTSPRPQT